MGEECSGKDAEKGELKGVEGGCRDDKVTKGGDGAAGCESACVCVVVTVCTYLQERRNQHQ